MLGGSQTLPIQPEQWQAYEGEPAFLLSQAYNELLQASGSAACGKLLDLSMFTDPPLPYFVYKGKPLEVSNPSANPGTLGITMVAGLPVDLWDTPGRNPQMLPPAVRIGAVVGHFYQVHHDSVADLVQLEAFLTDRSGQARRPAVDPRRRAVIFVQFPSALAGDTRRFAKKATPVVSAEPAEEAQVTVLEGEFDESRIPAVYEWWYGPAPAQHTLPANPIGHWKSYHPKVCRNLEAAFQSNSEFKSGEVPVDIDGNRYMMQHLTPEKPFDYYGKPGRETFLAENKITLDHPCYTDLDRASSNCFVQFQKGNPQRRRPARRRPDASELARSALMTGHPCSICFSEEGQLTGCNHAHVICKSCLRTALRVQAGDTLIVDNLLCGCFNRKTRRALMALAEHADVSLQDMLANPPKDRIEHQDFEAELHQTRRQFDLPGHGEIPSNIYAEKIREWFKKVNMADVAHLYHACSHPDCSDKITHWMLIEDFEREYQAKGRTTWVCPGGHTNSVLPTEAEINEMNKSLLSHPEYYVEAAYYSNCALRRYRMCPQCVHGGILMLAVHGGECKQWPGHGRGHQHCFCFACTRTWGSGCDHGSRDCRDPGVQQVRRVGDNLELGFVDGAAYIKWLRGEVSEPPPTSFPSGVEYGGARQARLGLTDKVAMLEEVAKGTI